MTATEKEFHDDRRFSENLKGALNTSLGLDEGMSETANKLEAVLSNPQAEQLGAYALQLQNDLQRRYDESLKRLDNMLNSIDLESLSDHKLRPAHYREQQRDMLRGALNTVSGLVESNQKSLDTFNLVPYTTAATMTINDASSENRKEEEASRITYNTVLGTLATVMGYMLKGMSL